MITTGAAGEGARSAVKQAEKPSPKSLGYAAYAAALDKTVFKGELGAIYSKTATTFRLWSPVATAVSVCIYKTGSDREQGAQMLSSTQMKYAESNGTWYTTLAGDFKNRYYTYRVTVNGETNEVVDPYAKAVGVNGDRGMIVDLSETDPEGWENDSFDRVDFETEAVVWEVNVRDFSASASSGVSEKNRGKYLAFTELQTTLNSEGSIPTCVAYLKELGVNYVQINPFYDFASIDESDTESEQYNWGYDPKNYNVPEGSYSSDPYDGRVRIKECKQMIKALHEAGIGVIMDVVYNHTYYSEDSFLNQIVPYYYHRINEDGSWSNGSGCGNDVATERYMARRLIRESVVYWAQEYHIDGFRFDLMGLMDVTTMNSIRVLLDRLDNGDKILMFGEAWNLNTTVPADVKLANQNNMNLLSKRIGAFNDTSRDAIKGSVFNMSEVGFVQEGKSKVGVRAAINGDAGGWATAPNQCVNYSSCHDNLTLYDKLTGSVYHDKEYQQRREDLVSMNKLSAAIILMSRGMPFMLAGEEMARTKLGDENSYISSVEINQIDWNSIKKYTSLIDYYKGLIQIRSAVGTMCDPSGSRSALTYLETQGKGTIAFTANGSSYSRIVAAFNGNPTESSAVTLPEGEWVILADGDRAGLISLGTVEGTLTVAPTSAAVLVDADDYAAIAGEGDTAVIYARYIDQDTSDVLLEQRIGGEPGSDYSVNIPQDILFRYDIVTEGVALSGVFEQPCKTVEILCNQYEGSFSSVTFQYVDGSGAPIADFIVMTGRTGEQYFAPGFPAVPGYRLDIDNLPDNGAGVFGEDPIEVVYRFVPDTGVSTPDEAEGACRINVIYLGSDGKVLEVKTYFGGAADQLQLDKKSFGGYEYLSSTDNYATFTEVENNLLICYASRHVSVLPYVISASAVILFIAAGAALSAISGKRRKKKAILIEE